MSDVDRAVAMATSLRKAAARVGVDAEGVEWLDRAHALAMQPRLAKLADDHHPAYLHPGRSALILMRDADVADAFVLATAAVLETRDAELRMGPVALDELGDEVRAAVLMVPLPGDEALAERLVTLPEGPLLAALAERLDHLRHEHVYADWSHGPGSVDEGADARGVRWTRLYEEVGAVWLPTAERTHARLAQRYRHWWRTFARRLGRH